MRAPGGWFSVLAMEVDKAPYDNPDIRMALMLAADREQMLKALFSGYGTTGNDHPIPPTDPYFNKELPQRKYDPEKAAFHFKKAGIADPKIILQASDAAFNGAVDQGDALAGERGQSRDQGRREEGARRRLLRQCLAEGAVRRQLLGRTAGGDADALRRLRRRERRGTRRTGTTRKFEKLLADARARPTRPSASPTSGKCRPFSTSAAARSSPCSATGSMRITKRSAAIRRMAAIDMDNGWIMENAWLKS